MLNLKNEIKDLIAQLGDLDVADIGDDTHLARDLRLDSIQTLDLLVELERKYNISIPETELGKFVSVNNLAGLVSDLLAATSRS